MKRLLLSIIFTSVGLTTFAQSSDDKLNIGVSLNHDAFFGFNPMLSGSYKATDKTAFTFYGIQWGAGTASAWGNWTEVGVGANFTAGNFNINPQLGFTMGSLLSSGAASRGVVGDGIVPNLTVNYDAAKLEGQFYGGYYGAFRNNTERGQSTNNYVHYWANLGVKATSWFSVGAHFENLYLSGGATNGGGTLAQADGYTWVGPYVQFKKGSAGMRFSFGSNVADESARFAPNDFYKLAFFFGI
ncbi:MAG: DUF6733 family protein [Spirosomataceae bacterium]